MVGAFGIAGGRGGPLPVMILAGWLSACAGGTAAGDRDEAATRDTGRDAIVVVPGDLPGEGPRDAGPDEGAPADAPGADGTPQDPGPPADAGDPGTADGGLQDPGSPDPGPPDPGQGQDAAGESGAPDAAVDTAPTDAGTDEAAPDLALDVAPVDPGTPDPGVPDLGAPDPGTPDLGAPDLGAPDTFTCSAVPVPDPVDPEPLAAMTPAGKVETRTAGGFTDEYLYDGTGLLKVGTRREWGASVVFFGTVAGGPGQNSTNVIDANDTGREVQIALYDPDRQMQGCAATASCRTVPAGACPTSITYLGWNPVQGGNECNHGSPAATSQAPGVLEAVVEPLFWNPDWQSADCVNTGCSDATRSWMKSDVRYTQRLRFVRTHVVEMQMAVENLSDVDHAPTIQEFPTLYASWGSGGPDLDVILDSAGNPIPVDIPANDGFFYRDFESPGGFVSLQGPTREYGVGLYYENRLTAFQAWQKQAVFNNVRSRFRFGLPARGTVMARAYLILGSFDTVRGEAGWLDAHLAPFGVLDAPAADAVVPGAVTVRGWALDNRGVTRVEALLDGVSRGTLAYGSARPDVCKVWPGYAGCDAVGFQGTLDLSGETPCAHLLELRATDDDGNARVIARRRVQLGGR